jgi:hypothetical protein
MDAALGGVASPMTGLAGGACRPSSSGSSATPPHVKDACSPVASLRDGLRPPLTRSGVPGLELASSRAARTVPSPCHTARPLTARDGHSRSFYQHRLSIGNGRHEW